MEGFNPLDLLASAAELQQKHDDGPERIIITRQRRSSTTKHAVIVNGQKENRELTNNNNVSKTKPSVVIVKKIKKVDVNPELEKMLDEHNYGNAKRNNNKLDKGFDSVTEFNVRKRKRTDSESDNCHTSELSIQTTTTEGRHIDKITTVVSNTASQPNESEHIHLKHTVECTDRETCSNSCLNMICMCTHTAGEIKCSTWDEGTKCDCQGPSKGILDSKVQHMLSTVIQSGDNASRTPDRSILKFCNSKHHINCDISVNNSEQCYGEDVMKLDEQTGEFISKNGANIFIKHSVNENGDDQNNLVNIAETEEVNQIPLHLENGDNETVTDMVSAKSVKSEAVSTQVNIDSASEAKKKPNVKVIPSEVVSEPVVNKQAQTLVINITRGRNVSDKLSKPTVSSCSDISNDTKYSDIGIIRSLLAKNKLNEMNNDDIGNKMKPVVLSIKSPKPKLEMPHCSIRDLGEKSSSCDSLQELELSDSICTGSSSTSVHLLSPDCRNPDSMGIVESPVTQNVNELSHSGALEDNIVTQSSSFIQVNGDEAVSVYSENDDDETERKFLAPKDNIPVLYSTDEDVTSSLIHSKHSNSALDLDIPSAEIVSDSRELMEDSHLLLTEKRDNCDNSANETLLASTSGNDIPIFRFDSDHCYAGMPGKINSLRGSVENETSLQSESEEAQTPLGSTSELSQDSGYEDVTQSPVTDQPSRSIIEENVEKHPTMKNLVPVLVSVNSNGCLTVHDTNLTKTLGGQVFLPENVNLITGTNLTSIAQTPLILSPVAVGKHASTMFTEAPKLIQANPESIIGLLGPKTPEINAILKDSQDISPPKFGTFKIGTFASFSNTGMGLESPTKLSTSLKPISEEKPKKITPGSTRSRSNSGKSGKSSPVVDTLGTLVQKVKSSLSPVPTQVELSGVDHIQHDHDYCTKNLMPSVVSSFLEARLLSKDTPKGKVAHTKGKRSDVDYKSESKLGKRKRNAASVPKEELVDDLDMDSGSDTRSISELLRPKYRNEKFNEPKRTDPKVKITGSSNFQDQFVYFMNTKKRSRRRESSKDIPLPYGTERVFIPPKPGDIIVPHLTDQDIEHLKIRSKQSKHSSGSSCYNSLRNEFMAVKLANGTFSATQPVDTIDDEKNIINTILSLENEDLASPVQSEPPAFNESMELYGQGLSADIMNLFHEQMNLTQEQMELLYSAVDEVQNSSPGLIGAEKLVSTESDDPTFQFPLRKFEDTNLTSTSDVAENNSNAAMTKAEVDMEMAPSAQAETTKAEDGDTEEPVVMKTGIPLCDPELVTDDKIVPTTPIAGHRSPITEVPRSPISEVPRSPITKVPRSPITEIPRSPVTEVPRSPVTEVPRSPVTEVPRSPVTEGPRPQITEVPLSPVTEVHMSPVTKVHVPRSPVTEVPRSPVTGVPRSPVTEIRRSSITEVPKSSITELPMSLINEVSKLPVAEEPRSPITPRSLLTGELTCRSLLTEEPKLLLVEEHRLPIPVESTSSLTETPINEGVTSVDSCGEAQCVGVDKVNEIVESAGEHDKSNANVADSVLESAEREILNIVSLNSGIQGIATPVTCLDNSVPHDENSKDVEPLVSNTSDSEEKTLFSPNLNCGRVVSSFESDISSVSCAAVSEISLPHIDKSLDLLGNDFRLDKGDLFPDTSVTDSAVPGSVVPPPSSVDYNAPWIVTVSMYWNDLPAIMINNQPYVRLVDIHKQILPAKDTGILKKRCQLMGVNVQNSSEMQRYFLVQYGRAFNSKSTLIISKEHAKILIGYYVDPQPKVSRPEDHHKSIIDHRREQLRRIALARRAAMRAQRLSEKKDEPDPREIKEPTKHTFGDLTMPDSVHELSRMIGVPKVASGLLPAPFTQIDSGRSQRATRHKKINFLELLRGDSSSHAGEEDTPDEHGKKQNHKVHHAKVAKRKKLVKERKVKVVKCTIETDSSEETESVESEYSSESYETDSSCESDIQVVNNAAKRRKISPSLVAKVKSRIQVFPKPCSKGSMKVKLGIKRSRPAATSTPVAIQVVNKSTGTKLPSSNIYRSKFSQKPRKEIPPRCYSPPIVLGKNILAVKNTDLHLDKQNDLHNVIKLDSQKADTCENGTSTCEIVDLSDTSVDEIKSEQILKINVGILGNDELKISPTLPENILETSELPDPETIESSEVKSVNVQTDSNSFENIDAANMENVDCSVADYRIANDHSEITEYENDENINGSGVMENERSQSPIVTESSVSVMKRKEIVQIGIDEISIRIIHKDCSLHTPQRMRSQLGELFVGRYYNKKSLCVRCYTCRKMMSVDNFLHHLHDVSGGLLPINVSRTVDMADADLSEGESKHWETFLRKKELFDNNQLPSPEIVGETVMYSVDGNADRSFMETVNSGETSEKQSGPRIITTPVSPLKKEKIVRKNRISGQTKPRFISNQPASRIVKTQMSLPMDGTEGVRTSSRKRKVKHLYGFEDYSFTKFPRLMKNAVVEEKVDM